MSDQQLLFLVLALVYAWECACWVRRGSVGFRTWFGRRWRPAHPGSVLGNQQGGFIFAHPLPPLGTLLTGNQFPLSLSADAVLAFVSPSVNPGGRPAQTGRLFRFDEIRTIETSGKKVRVNGELLLKAASPTFAEYLAQQLRQLGKLAPEQRERAIETMIRDSFDTKAIERRWQEFQPQAANVRWLTNCVFAWLFLLAPALIWHFGLRHSWPSLVLGLLALTISTAIAFRRVHKTFYPTAEDERFTHFLTILLSPATTVRAHDVLSRPLLETFHPLAIAKVFCPEAAFRDFARAVLVDILHPAAPVCPRPEPQAQAAESHSRAILRRTVEAFLKRSGVAPETLTQPPPPADETCRSYCPRCLAQFTTPEGTCADCGGVALLPFPKTPPERTTHDRAPS